jgi:Carboxypeptidase regulatory-like domain
MACLRRASPSALRSAAPTVTDCTMPLRLPAAVLVLAALCFPAASASAGTITGRVTDEISGAPVQNITVGAGPVGYGLRDYARTGPDGTYAIEEPQAGPYNVCFLPDAGVNLLKRCWHDETVSFYGQAITVPESGTVAGIDTALAPGTSVAGIVTDWDGRPLPGVCVSAWTPHSGWLRVADATTSASGSYTLVGLTPGAVNKIVFSPLESFMGHCDDGIDYPGFAAQWFDRQSDVDAATGVIAERSETLAGVDGLLGPSATPPAGAAPRDRQCVVPTLRNRTFAYARAALVRAGCSTPMPALAASRSFERGRVITSRPAAKQRVRRGRPVRLIVSRGH